MQNLGGHGAVSRDDFRDVLGAYLLACNDLAQAGIDPRESRQLPDAAHGRAHARLAQQVLQLHAPLDHLLQPLRLARLGDVLSRGKRDGRSTCRSSA